MKTSLALALVFFSFVVSAGTNFYTEANERLLDLLRIQSETARDKLSPNCVRRYQNLYKDGVLNVALGFGYWDNSPGEYVFDAFIANGLKAVLLAECTPGRLVCGFTAVGDVFTKWVPGPDGKANRFTISLSQGSLTTSNLNNTTVYKDKQNTRCEAARSKYFREIAAGSEVAMYVGHSRDGGGPDFCPPVRDPNKHTDYPWYRKNRPGLSSLVASMDAARTRGKQTQVLAMYSCYSHRHFYQKISSKTRGPDSSSRTSASTPTTPSVLS